MNCLGKISAFHFLRSLELLTNADGLAPPPVSGSIIYFYPINLNNAGPASRIHVHHTPVPDDADDEVGG
jgi:hypothetical protein